MDYPKDVYPYRLSDMIAGAVTHNIARWLAIIGTIFLFTKAETVHSMTATVSVLIFGLSMILSYSSSTLYHALARTRARHVFHILDHCMIYLLIAGTYTPLVLISIGGRLGWTLFAIVWILAAMGIVYKSIAIDKHNVASAVLYLAMGWLAVFFIVPLWHSLPFAGIMLLIGGGISYTVGMLFFSFDDIPYFHAIWHLFVLGGSIFHFFLIFQYVI
ncbi:MAG: hemolysin III family protein [Candidatus Pacebacteria bacterium]|nr:hemolysin III family protein [Candidatus Paceibacterota bacterium]